MSDEMARLKSANAFKTFKLHPALMRGIQAMGFETPRPIQKETIPEALKGRDILGLAQTGTGKTAAFALPVLDRLLAEQKARAPRVLIVAPTRELASQIDQEIQLLARFTKVKTATLFGGVKINSQIRALRRRPEIVVACPGRLLDLLGRRALSLDGIEILILDEADHMFDMGFLPDLRRIIDACPESRQNLMFSATMPKEIRRLAHRVLRDPHTVDLNQSRPVSTIEHALYPIDQREKLPLLREICREEDFASAIVFTRTKFRAKRLAVQLSNSGLKAVALQGNMSQSQRVRAMDGFRQRRFDILVATDIAARGIDVEQVSHVVNFDMPSTVDAYTHRIGRTGRAEREGKAYTFVTGQDQSLVGAVENRLGTPIPRKTLKGFATIRFPKTASRSGRPSKGGRSRQNRSR